MYAPAPMALEPAGAPEETHEGGGASIWTKSTQQKLDELIHVKFLSVKRIFQKMFLIERHRDSNHDHTNALHFQNAQGGGDDY